MKILILSFYYPPDLSAGSFRVDGLVKALMAKFGEDVEIEVITTKPNRYLDYRKEVESKDEGKFLKIYRLPVPEHNSGLFDQAKSFFFFACGVIKIVKKRDFDFVFATSSRLMTALLGAGIARWKMIPLYLDIRDIFVDTIGDIFPKVATIFFVPIFSLLERFTIGSATHINLVSPGFGEYFKRKYPSKHPTYFMNGIDEEFLVESFVGENLNVSRKTNNAPLRILYAGNIGEGQGLHKIIPILAMELGEQVEIRVIGSGGRVKQLRLALDSLGVNNVEIFPPMALSDLIQEYQDANILFLHLNDYSAFKKVLPSKIFEYAALGKPILAGVSGYAAEFLRQEVLNCAVFPPCNADGAIEALSKLSIENTKRDKFIKKYMRENIMYLFAEDMVSRLRGK